jgi:hypothetical protein
MYHHEHTMARTVCGPVCNAWPDVLSFKPPAKADRLTEKALKLERKGNHARAPEYYRAALGHAEEALGMDHGYLAWVLVRANLAGGSRCQRVRRRVQSRLTQEDRAWHISR